MAHGWAAPCGCSPQPSLARGARGRFTSTRTICLAAAADNEPLQGAATPSTSSCEPSTTDPAATFTRRSGEGDSPEGAHRVANPIARDHADQQTLEHDDQDV